MSAGKAWGQGSKAEAEKWFKDLQDMITRPYPKRATSSPLAGMGRESMDRHLLATPRRKTALFLQQSGDYENDRHMTEDMEFAMEKAIGACYAALCKRMAAKYGPVLSTTGAGLPLQQRIRPDADDEVLRLKSYETGAYYDNGDSGKASFWKVGADYVCIQEVRIRGDGDFEFYVIATMTPPEPA